MKKTNVLLLAGLLAAANQAGATISASTSGPSELFLVVYDSTSKKTYYKDLGITATDFVAGAATSCVDGNIAGDANFASFLSSATTVFNVAAFNPYVKANDNDWGYMLTSATDGTIFPTASSLVDQTTQNVQGYAVELNGTNIGNPSANLSGVYDSTGDPLAGYLGGAWGAQINLSVKGSTEGSKTLNPGFFFVSGKSNTATKLGTFSLASGVLSFTSASGAGTTKICNYTPTPTPTPTPIPTPVPAADVKVTAPSTGKVGKAVSVSFTKSAAYANEKVVARINQRSLGLKAAKVTSFTFRPTLKDIGTDTISVCTQKTLKCGTAKITISK
ncbi:MAG: hypothetical protein D4R76_04620 [Methylococcus sp.]|nr:MAG: hypothetical protein D4R76_04620 [Methylococcus sp.]